MIMLLQNKNIIVTGSNRGIGKSMLKVFAQNGANIWACSRIKSEEFELYIKQLKDEFNVDIEPIYFDITNLEQMKDAIKEIKKDKKSIDVLVNNAGAIFTAPFTMTSISKMKDLFDINYFSQVQFTQYIVKSMMRQKSGSIINISSSAAIEANEGRSAYAGSKSALITTTKVMARELGAVGIRVNSIAPGLTQTDMMEESTPIDALEYTIDRLCIKRVALPEEIANTALFLASDLSSYVTAQTISVDGGM